MIDCLYFVFIAPLEFLMQWIFDKSLATFNSYGAALIAMSFVVSTATLPIYNKAECWQEEERAIRKKMERWADMIKRCYHGQERFAYLNALYRVHDYNFTMLLRSSVGFLLQIPFFFAAYHLLSNMSTLTGQSFWILKDLGQPDKLLTIAGCSIHVIPLLMTAVNLLSAFVYSQQLTCREKVQLYAMALLFLVLLYEAPAALTFYWTMNNIYSFGKNIVEKSLLPKWKSNGTFVHRMLQTRTDKFFEHLRPLSSKGLLCPRKQTLAGKGVESLFWPAVSLIALVALLYFPTNFYLSDPLVFPENLHEVLIGQLQIATVFLFFCAVIWFFIPNNLWASFTLLAAFVTLVICIPEYLCEVLFKDFYIVDTVTAFCLLAWILLWNNFRTSLAFFASFGALVFLVYGFILVPDYGLLTEAFEFEYAKKLYQNSYRYLDAAILPLLFFATYWILVRHKARSLCSLMIALCFGITCTLAYKITSHDKPLAHHITVTESDFTVPSEVTELFRFTKTGKNIVVVMLDMFTGGNIRELLEREPTLRTRLDGFTWYLDTTSVSDFTVFGKPLLLGGYPSHPLKINEEDNLSIEVKHNRNWGSFLSLLQENDYRVAVHEDEFLQPQVLRKYLKEPGILIDSWDLWPGALNYWKRESGYAISETKPRAVSSKSFLTMFGVFRAFPCSLKRIPYKGGYWRGTVAKDSLAYWRSLANLAKIDSFHLLSTARSGDRNQFKFLFNELTHVPWSIDSDCMPCNKEYGSRNEERNPETGLWEAHLRTEICTLKSLLKWTDWMKKNDVYDNTLLIFVSDHGRGDSSQMMQTWSGSDQFDPKKSLYPVAAHSLLLVKGFNQRGALQEDRTQLMATWDIPELIKQSLSLPAERLWMDKNRQRILVLGDSSRQRHAKNTYDIKSTIVIEGTMFDKRNWKRLP